MLDRFPRFLSAFLFGVLALMLPLSSASAQTLDDAVRYSERLPAPGGPALGRSGAGLFAGTAAPNALFGNPAGLGWMSASMITGDLAVNRARGENQFQLPTATPSSDRTVNDYRLGRLAGAYAFPTEQGSFVVAGSFHQSNTYDRGFNVQGNNQANSITGTFLPTSGGYEVDGEDLIFNRTRSRLAYESGAIDFSDAFFQEGRYPFLQAANPVADTTGNLVLEQQDDVLETGQMNEVSLGAAVAIAPRVMLGGGLNIVFGEYTFERLFRETDASGLQPPENPDNPQSPYDPYFLSGTSLEGFDEFQLEERIRTDLSGVNLRFGLSAQLVEGLRGGLHVETPTWLALTETYGTRMRTFFDCDFSSGSCIRPDEPFSSNSTLTDNEFDYRLNTPPRLGAGLQYSRNGLMLAGGIEVVDWTQAEFDTDNSNAQGFIRELNRDLESLDETINTRVGAEYAFDALTVRAGMTYQPDPLDQSFEDIDGSSTDGDQLSLSAGLGYAFSEQATLNVNWMQERFDDQFQSYRSLSGPSPTVRESITRNRFLIGLTYRY